MLGWLACRLPVGHVFARRVTGRDGGNRVLGNQYAQMSDSRSFLANPVFPSSDYIPIPLTHLRPPENVISTSFATTRFGRHFHAHRRTITSESRKRTKIHRPPHRARQSCLLAERPPLRHLFERKASRWRRPRGRTRHTHQRDARRPQAVQYPRDRARQPAGRPRLAHPPLCVHRGPCPLRRNCRP